ncbi:MAG: hypothetical protein QXG65_02225 [Thermoplasmata archaeon]
MKPPPPSDLAGRGPRAADIEGRPAVVIDDAIRYIGPEREVSVDRDAMASIAASSGIAEPVLEYLLATHGRCHEAMRRSYEARRVPTSAPEYDRLDDRIIEHYSQLVMYYLLFAPAWVRGILPARYHGSLPPADGSGFLRDFLSLGSLQVGRLHVDHRDFTATKPTASIEMGIRLPARGHVTDFEAWHKHVLGRAATDCMGKSPP